MSHSNRAPNFGSLLALDLQLSKDLDESERVLKLRDKGISANHLEEGDSDLGKVITWAREVAPEAFLKSQRFETYFPLILIFLGLLVGVLTGVAVFYYNGDEPINILPIIFVFVLFPLITLFFTLLLFLPNYSLSRMPFIGTLLLGVSRLSPAQYVLSKLSQRFDLKQSSWFSRVGNTSLQKWFFMAGAQIFSLCFFVGALGYFLVQLVVSDLAFGWSSTLNIGSDAIYTLTNFVSAPWRAILPEAVPSLDLIEVTRFFRLEDSATIRSHPEAYGSWWVFVASCVFVYGVLPRAVLLFFAMLIRDSKIKAAHLKVPGVSQLLWRLDSSSPQLDSRSDLKVVGSTVAKEPIELTNLRLPKESCFISWAFTLSLAQINAFSFGQDDWSEEELFSVATGSEMDEEKVIEEVLSRSPKTVCLLVKAWEVPTEEIIEFARELENRLSKKTEVFVVPVNPSSSEILSAKDEKFVQVWARKLKSLEDSRVVLRVIGEGV